MTPAELVVKMFGGPSALGKALRLNKSTVSRWDDEVPSKHHRKLLKLAGKKGVVLTAEMLVYGLPDKS